MKPEEMEMDIGPGDWMECVKLDKADPTAIVVGSMYQVSEIVPATEAHPCFDCGDDGDALTLAGKPSRDLYCHCCFRRAGKGGMFNDLLTAKPVRVGEDA